LGIGQVGGGAAEVEVELHGFAHGRCALFIIVGEGLPAFAPGAQVQLEGPCITGLAVEIPVVLGNVLWIENAVLVLGRVLFGEALADKIGIDGTVDYNMGDVNVHRPQFTRHALRQGTNPVLGAGERRKSLRPHAGRR